MKKQFVSDRLTHVRDVFVFCCFTGLAFIDVKQLRKEDLTVTPSGDMVIRKQRQKSGVFYNVPLLPIARQILDKYKDVPIQGTFNGDTTYPNLFCFIIAPAASGKGVLKYAKAIGAKRQTLLHESEPSINIFIPANISTAMIYQHLHANGGNGILFESEADTMTNTLKNDWGTYDDLLRKAFHFEEASLERRDRTITIEHPRLSVILSGTPNQIQGIIQ